MDDPTTRGYAEAMRNLKAALDHRDRRRAARERAAGVSLDTRGHQRPRSTSPRQEPGR